ncbi:MAG TPA: TetR family transcriptional regulator C-terminal domain-containing protein [Novosphingobium sp.]|nr:TetR family transcriptional regulator C-terminal domain-containing protein [Novosphingobium sp.]HZV08620.1 TetR family transcriptional regulator C-terminal domain-containing protein [Novosphingobium sp.]
MPRIVDHEQRRKDIARVVSALVLKGGAEAVTIRAVAQACGFSTAVVCHYFASKHAMLAYTQRLAWQRGLARITAAGAAGAPLEACLAHALPDTPAGWEDWHCWMAFWGQAPETDGIEADWRESIAVSNAVFVDLVRRAQAQGAFDPEEDPSEAATGIQIMLNGIASLVAQGRGEWPAERQRAVLRRQLRRLGYRPAE